MTRILIATLLALPANAQKITVAVATMDGKGGGTRQIGKFQTALKRIDGVRIQSTRGFVKESKAQGVLDFIRDDARAVTNVCEALGVDVVIFGQLMRPDREAWPKARKRDKVVRLAVVAGRDGRIVGEHEVFVRRGRLTRAVWKEAARAVERDLFRAAEPPPPPPPPPPRREPEPQPTFEEPVSLDDEVSTDRKPGDVGTIYVGLKLMSRTFSYAATADSAIFAEGGIEYESAFVPGFAIDAELYPLRLSGSGAGANVGVELHYEKVFLVTRQAVETEAEMGGEPTTSETELDTSHDHFLGRLLYRHAFGEGDLVPAVKVFAGFGVLSITIDKNDEYNGTTYSYLDLGIGGSVPFSRYVILEGEFHGVPFTSLGDSAEELGKDVSATGFGLYAGVSSRLTDDIVARAGVDYLALDADVSGEGRGGRVGSSAEDGYLGLRLQAGYRF